MLQDAVRAELTGRVTVVGVGETQRGDDGVGPMVAQRLEARGVRGVIDAGASPELDTWRVRECAPECVLFVDAVDFGGSPGDVALLQSADLRRWGVDTHRAPLRLTMEYLERELGCRCCLIAIQPKDARIGSGMCDEVRSSAEQVTRILLDCLAGAADDGRSLK
jgi:hydrogenase 3 maturation protease